MASNSLATSRTAERLQLPLELGAEGILVTDGSFADQVRAHTTNHGADVILDLVVHLHDTLADGLVVVGQLRAEAAHDATSARPPILKDIDQSLDIAADPIERLLLLIEERPFDQFSDEFVVPLEDRQAELLLGAKVVRKGACGTPAASTMSRTLVRV